MIDPRILALEVLIKGERQHTPADPLLNPRLAQSGLPDRDRRLAMTLVRTTHRWRGRCDRVLDRRLKRGLRSLDRATLNILRMGYIQLHHMTQIPPHAAVNSSVEMARKKGGEGKAKLVNSILRGLIARPPLPEEYRSGRGAEIFEGELSHPAWLLERWLAQFGEEETRRICAWNNEAPNLHLRVHGDEAHVAAVRTQLEEEGFTISPGDLLGEILRVAGSFAVSGHPLLRDGVISVQDESQAIIGRLWPDLESTPILDMCAAPGTKASHIAELTGRGQLFAADLAFGRLRRVCETIARLGIENVHAVVADGRRPPFGERFARVLLDAPCTGLGVLRRRPDARWLRSPGEIRDAAALQTELLAAAATLVQPGGLILYSACSLEPEETSGQVERFRATQPQFTCERLPVWIPPELQDPAGCLRILPGQLGMEGVFAALLRRRDA